MPDNDDSKTDIKNARDIFNALQKVAYAKIMPEFKEALLEAMAAAVHLDAFLELAKKGPFAKEEHRGILALRESVNDRAVHYNKLNKKPGDSVKLTQQDARIAFTCSEVFTEETTGKSLKIPKNAMFAWNWLMREGPKQ